MSRISFNERRLLNRVRKLENRIAILGELSELRAGREAEKVAGRYLALEQPVLRELAGAEYEGLTQQELELALTQHRQQAEREKFQKLQADALLSGIYRRRVKRIYSLKDYEVTAYKNSASALISLEADGRIHSDRMTGDGPVDAGFKAINSLTGQNFKLTDYQVHSVSEGKDALGEATVKLASPEDGKVMTGKGISTDVLEASLIAYINATNKLLQEE